MNLSSENSSKDPISASTETENHSAPLTENPSEEGLPQGWTTGISRKNGKKYYFNERENLRKCENVEIMKFECYIRNLHIK